MAVSLVLVRPNGEQREVPLTRPVQIIGRQTDCQIRVPIPSVSRHHCEITVADGRPSVRDLGSSNGTYVNRRKVSQTELAAGDLLAVGELVFVVRIDGNPRAIDSEDVLEDGAVLLPGSAAAPAAAPATAPKVGGKPAPKKADPADSSVSDFDFLDEDEEINKQPRL